MTYDYALLIFRLYSRNLIFTWHEFFFPFNVALTLRRTLQSLWMAWQIFIIYVSAARQSREPRLHREELQEETDVWCVQAEHRQPRGVLQRWVHVSVRDTDRRRWRSPWLPSLCLTVRIKLSFLCAECKAAVHKACEAKVSHAFPSWIHHLTLRRQSWANTAPVSDVQMLIRCES